MSTWYGKGEYLFTLHIRGDSCLVQFFLNLRRLGECAGFLLKLKGDIAQE